MEIENETGLADDTNEFSERISAGTLAFSEDDGASPEKVSSDSKCSASDDGSCNLSIPFEFDNDMHSHQVTFDIVAANIIKEGRSKKHVMYTIQILRDSTVDPSPVVVDRRYSDFEKLNSSLRQKFAQLMSEIVFPKKVLMGNFKPETIAQRSRAFEQYLTHVYSVDLLLYSKQFADFFYGDDLATAHTHILNGQYKDCVHLLRSVLYIQQKLLGESHRDVIATLCAMVAALYALEDDVQALSLVQVALKCIDLDEHNCHLVPLLQVGVRLCWKLGRDKKNLEEHLHLLKSHGLNVHSAPALLELVINTIHTQSTA